MAARTPAGRRSERRARRAARTVSGMRHSGGGWPVRRTLEAPMRGGPPWDRPTHATRQRQLRDEVKSGGSQPTYIRVIHRRSSAARRLNLDPMPPRERPARFGTKHPVDLWPSPSDRHAPCGPCGPPVDNAGALPTAGPHSRASRPQAPRDRQQRLFHEEKTGYLVSY